MENDVLSTDGMQRKRTVYEVGGFVAGKGGEVCKPDPLDRDLRAERERVTHTKREEGREGAVREEATEIKQDLMTGEKLDGKKAME